MLTLRRPASQSDQFSSERAALASDYTAWATSKTNACILSFGATASACTCPETRMNGSICCSFTKIGMTSVSHYTFFVQYSHKCHLFSVTVCDMVPRSQFLKACLMTAWISLSGATSMTAASCQSPLLGNGIISRSLGLR